MRKIIVSLFLLIHFVAKAQVSTLSSLGVGVVLPDSSAQLEVSSQSKGILIPRLTQFQRNAISNPANGLLIFQTDNYAGFYYYTGNTWLAIQSAASMVANAPSYGSIYLTVPNATIFASALTPTKLLGTTVLEKGVNVISPISNRLVNSGTVETTFYISATISAIPSAANRNYSFYFSKNGVVIPSTWQRVNMSSTSGVYPITLNSIVTLKPNDYVEVYVANDISTTSITADTFTMQMFKIN